MAASLKSVHLNLSKERENNPGRKHRDMKGQNKAGKRERSQASRKKWTPTESQQLPESARAAGWKPEASGTSEALASAVELSVRPDRAASRRGTAERYRKDDSHLAVMSTVSWQKETGGSESINFQIGCWSMTAGKATATSSRGALSALHGLS